MNKVDAIEILKNRDSLLNIDIIENLKNENSHLIYLDEKGFLIENHKTQMISFEKETEINFFDKKIDNSKIIVVHQEFYKNHLIKKGYKVLSNCHQAVYEKDTLSIDLPLNVEIKILTIEQLDFVFSHYNKFVDIDYLKERIANKQMVGLFFNNQITGFIGIHKEGAIGMLEIDEKYRRRNFATFLEKYIVNKQLEDKKIPYCQIVDGNEKSMALQKKIGFSFAKEMIFWMKKV
ncbi:MAG: GNAT family N-acetyltransferase [Sphaerochaetaceae bacterium]|nr:GNAT family N-acetyltransferase [Sphaerochaetaceae bacterium]